MIYIGADHRGFELKQRIVSFLEDFGLEITDLGNDHLDPSDDYVDYAGRVAKAVSENPGSFGILLCGTGVGVDIVANKFDGVRSALVDTSREAQMARNDDDANVISLPADILDEETSLEIIQTFLDTPFSGEQRHQRRLEKIEEIEVNN